MRNGSKWKISTNLRINNYPKNWHNKVQSSTRRQSIVRKAIRKGTDHHITNTFLQRAEDKSASTEHSFCQQVKYSGREAQEEKSDS